jgi:integrase
MRPSTAELYRRLTDRHVRDGIGRLRAQDLRASHLDSFYGDLLTGGRRRATGEHGEGLLPGTVALVHKMLSGAFTRAAKCGDVASNPCRLASSPSAAPAETRSWTIDEARMFFTHDVVRAHPDVVLFRLLWATGLRRGEALALQWDDVDFDAGVIQVRRNAVTVDGTVTVGEPKTSRSKRRVKLGPDACEMLRGHRAAQREHRVTMGAGWRGGNLVFPAVDGRLRNPDGVSKAFRALVAKTDLPAISLHGLRHTAATLMLERGVPVHVAAARLGHDPSVLLRRYSHAVIDSQDAAAALEGLLDGESRPALAVVPDEDEPTDESEPIIERNAQ